MDICPSVMDAVDYCWCDHSKRRSLNLRVTGTGTESARLNTLKQNYALIELVLGFKNPIKPLFPKFKGFFKSSIKVVFCSASMNAITWVEIKSGTVYEWLYERNAAFEICWEGGILGQSVSQVLRLLWFDWKDNLLPLRHCPFGPAHHGLHFKRVSNYHQQRDDSTLGVCVHDVLGVLYD